jgi:GntR family transcriptional regulator, arabinose operon transcriptional repressor
LRIESGELAPGAKLEPEEALATRLGVSRHTAHRALHELQRQGLIARQRRWGSVVASHPPKKANRVAYMVDFANIRFQGDLMMHIEHALPEDTRLVVTTSKGDPEREAENLRRISKEVDGIICYPADGDSNAAVFNQLADSGYPLVLIDRAPRGSEHLVVLTDNEQASQDAVQKLVDRGHRRIAFFGSNNDHAQSVRERFNGYCAAVAPLNYSVRTYERWIPLALEKSPESMFQAVIDALVAMRFSPDPPTAAFCVHDRLAMGLIEACEGLNLTIGTDFDIATFNDYGHMFLRQHWRFHRILQQMDLMSVAAVERLNALMRGEQIPRGPLRIPVQFIPAEESHPLLAPSFVEPDSAS